uniref:Uncharacterized protein n=1 Tax=Oryza glumipatula TaxID=40148 RepID=A0A0E0AP21_9ORYZ
MGRIGREKMSKGGCGVRVVILGGGSVQVVVPDGGGVDVQEEGKYQKENKQQEYLEAMIMAAHVAAAAWNRVAPLPTSPSRRPLQAQAVARMDRPRHAVVVRCEKKKKGAADEPAGELGPEEGGDPHQVTMVGRRCRRAGCGGAMAAPTVAEGAGSGVGREPGGEAALRGEEEGRAAAARRKSAGGAVEEQRRGGLDDTPFNYEINKIRGYWTEIHSAKISYLTVRMYVSTFVKTAEDTYHRKVDRATILSFLCALQVWLHSQPDYSPNHDVEVTNRSYQQEIKRLINNFREASTTEALEAAPLHPVMLPHQMTSKMSS